MGSFFGGFFSKRLALFKEEVDYSCDSLKSFLEKAKACPKNTNTEISYQNVLKKINPLFDHWNMVQTFAINHQTIEARPCMRSVGYSKQS